MIENTPSERGHFPLRTVTSMEIGEPREAIIKHNLSLTVPKLGDNFLLSAILEEKRFRSEWSSRRTAHAKEPITMRVLGPFAFERP